MAPAWEKVKDAHIWTVCPVWYCPFTGGGDIVYDEVVTQFCATE